MLRKRFPIPALCFLSLIFYFFYTPSAKETIPKQEVVCYECHEEIKSIKVGNKHAPLPCSRCHGQLTEHLKDPEKHPGTNLELSLCGKCHPSQYETLMSVNLKASGRMS